MYTYDDIISKLNIENNDKNRKYIKAIVHAAILNGDATVQKQLIYIDINYVMYMWNIIDKFRVYFDYSYNTKIDLTKFLYYIGNGKKIILNAIFCPGYTKDGYKNYIGENNTRRLEILYHLKEKLETEKIAAKFNITLADIFLENTSTLKNPNWQKELALHVKKFQEKASNYFKIEEILLLSTIFNHSKFMEGFINENLTRDKTYLNFYKNNLDFYHKMGWNETEIQKRNDKLYTIYNIISKYINNQQNGIYLPMETMYSRSKVMTKNQVCTMYLYKE